MGKTAIEAPRTNMFLVDPDELTIVGLDTEAGPEHELYDERIKLPVDPLHVDTVVEHGVLEPVLVRKNGTFLEVIDGRQRVRWQREANKRLASAGKPAGLVPVVVKRMDSMATRSAIVVTNEIRQADDPITRAKKAQRLIDAGRTQKDVARDFGVTPQAIGQWLKLLDLAPQVQRRVEHGHISASAAAALAVLPREEQVEKVAELIEAGGSTQEARKIAKPREKGEKGDGDSSVSPAPSKSILKKLEATEGWDSMDEHFRHAIEWVLGKRAPRSIKGLSALLAKIQAEKV